MKRCISFGLSMLFAASLAFGGISSVALTYVNETPLVMIKGEERTEVKDRIKVGKDYGTISACKSSDNAVVRVGMANRDGVQLYANQAGTATLTITSYTEDTDGSMFWHTVTMTVKVVTETENTASLGVSSDIVLEYNGKYTEKSQGYYQITRMSSSDSMIATGEIVTDGDLQYPMVKAGAKKGEATVTFFYRIAGQSGDNNKIEIKVAVIAPGDKAAKPVSTNNSNASGNYSTPSSSVTPSVSATEITDNALTASVPAGEVTRMTDSFYAVSNVKSNNTSVATAASSGSQGAMGLNITGVAAGTAVVTFDTKESADASAVSRSVTVTVTAAASNTATRGSSTTDPASTSTTSTGIYLSTRSYKTTVGKTLYAPVKIDGTKIDRTKDTAAWAKLRWVSSDPKVLTVDSQTGKVKTVGKGTAKLVCVDKDGKSCDAMTITVS